MEGYYAHLAFRGDDPATQLGEETLGQNQTGVELIFNSPSDLVTVQQLD
jgi:hypothetical protein